MEGSRENSSAHDAAEAEAHTKMGNNRGFKELSLIRGDNRWWGGLAVWSSFQRIALSSCNIGRYSDTQQMFLSIRQGLTMSWSERTNATHILKYAAHGVKERRR